MASKILWSSASLQDTENHLMAQWVTGRTLQDDVEKSFHQDIRLNLRHYFHAPNALDDYGLVLIDCPPRLTAACVNAVAASDYIIIPVVPDQISCEPVPTLIGYLRELREAIAPNVKILGLVPNRAKTPFSDHSGLLRELVRDCSDIWGSPLRVLSEAYIPDRAALAKTEANTVPILSAQTPKDVKAQFDRLAQTIEDEIPSMKK
jgi:cellulose biosynthesis protein BcsQ